MGLVIPDYGLLFWMLLSFGIVIFLLAKFAWKPILSSLKEREDSIENALDTAKKAKVEMQELKAGNEKIIIQAKNERERLIKEAKEVKENIIKEAKSQASVEANKLISTARKEIESEKSMAINEIKAQVTELSIEIAEKILMKELNNKDVHQKYIKELLNDISPN